MFLFVCVYALVVGEEKGKRDDSGGLGGSVTVEEKLTLEGDKHQRE